MKLFNNDIELKHFQIVVKHEDVETVEKERAIIHYISTKDLDWGDDIVDPKGMDATEFEKYRTVFYNHNYNIPLAKNLWLKADDYSVLAKTAFGRTLFADDIYQMHKDGILNTWSIGFRPTYKNGQLVEGAVVYDKATNKTYYNLWQLFEYSSAPLAMNSNALDQIKSFAKSDTVKDMIEVFETKSLVTKAVDEYAKQFKELSEQLKSFGLTLNELVAKIDSVESEQVHLYKDLKDAKEEYGKITANVKKNVVETTAKQFDVDAMLKSINYENIARGVVSEITGKRNFS